MSATDVQHERSESLPTQSDMYMYVQLCGEWLLIPFQQVQEVADVAHVTQLPSAPDWCLGFCLLKGRVLPVFDIRSILFPQKSYETMSFPLQVIVVIKDGKRFCVVTEATRGLIPISLYRSSPALLRKVLQVPWVTDIAEVEGGVRMVLDMSHLYKIAEVSLSEKRGQR